MEPVSRVLRKFHPPKSIWMHLPFTGIADFKLGSTKVRMRHLGFQIENSMFWAGYGTDFEATSLLLWERLATDAAVTFDVGANTGLFALSAKACSPKSKVYAFEPQPDIFGILLQNTELNGFDIVAIRAAVSDVAGKSVIKTTFGGNAYSASLEHMDWMSDEKVEEIEVDVTRLADVIARTGHRPDLIKLDIERHEASALRGLWVDRSAFVAPIILCEILDREVGIAVAAEIENRGYATYVIVEGGCVRTEKLVTSEIYGNWLFVPQNAQAKWLHRLKSNGIISHSELLANRPNAKFWSTPADDDGAQK